MEVDKPLLSDGTLVSYHALLNDVDALCCNMELYDLSNLAEIQLALAEWMNALSQLDCSKTIVCCRYSK